MTSHRFDVFSFLAGGTAVAIAALVLLGEVPIRIVDLRIVGPVLVLALGLALLLGGSRSREQGAVGSDDLAAVDPDVVDAQVADADVADADRDPVASTETRAGAEHETGSPDTDER